MEKDDKKDDEKVKQDNAWISALLQLYQSAAALVKTDGAFSILAMSIKNDVIEHLANMITIVERKDWLSVHPHESFPKIDIRMLISECPVSIECAFLLAILRKIGMSKEDYINYRKRAGTMISMEHKRKMGKR